MPRGLYRSLLILALSLPGAAGALGLGDIRVDSALNEPLSAQIDIVGATDEELIALRAAVASRETFQRYGAERAAFLSTASFKVTRAADGQAILTVHSDASGHRSAGDPVARCELGPRRIDQRVLSAARSGTGRGCGARTVSCIHSGKDVTLKARRNDA